MLVGNARDTLWLGKSCPLLFFTPGTVSTGGLLLEPVAPWMCQGQPPAWGTLLGLLRVPLP